MNRRELEIVKQIVLGLFQEGAAFAHRIACGPRLSARYKAGLAAIAAGTSRLRRRPLKPADESPLEVSHRLTARLFRNTRLVVESNLDQPQALPANW